VLVDEQRDIGFGGDKTNAMGVLGEPLVPCSGGLLETI
jgi:hypothetical protein